MKKKVLLVATMAAVLASCSSDDLSLQSSNQEAAQDGQYALAFDALTQRSISTRAGLGGAVMDDDRLKKSVEEGGGFGVFAYQTENNMEYTDGLNAKMRMWNEKVTYDNGSWSYDHVQYWPNEFGSDAQSDDIKRVSFFAYAPFVDAATTGKVDDISGGITGFTSNTTKGDPYVKYVASFDPATSVDLCWGVCGEPDKSWKIIQGNAVQDMTAGLPWLDVQRPAKAIGQKVKFTFQHALAQLNVQIDADPDIEEHDEESKIADGTKVYVRSITFSGFAQKGALNLNNTDSCVAKWEAYNCCSEELKSESVTLYDGRKDANPGVAGAVASGEKLQSLNPTIISNDGNTTEGVTEKPKNLFNSTNENAPVYVIPTDDEITVTITYGIETVDDHLAGYLSDKQTHGHWKDYTITKQVKFGEATKLENGKKYTLNIHLAMNSVKFDAAVSPWDDTAEAGDVYLPSNVAKGVSLNKSTLLLEPNEEETLTATVTPSDAVDKTVTWTSSDENIATVDNGKVTAKAPGSVTITATSNGQSTTCEVTIDAINTLAKLKSHVDIADPAKYLGYYVDAEGNISETDNNSVGRIAYYGTDDVEELDGTQNILVFYNPHPSLTAVSWKVYSTSATYRTEDNAWAENMNARKARNGYEFTISHNNDGYPAANAVFSTNHEKPSGGTAWFLPSISQLEMMGPAIVQYDFVPINSEFISATPSLNLNNCIYSLVTHYSGTTFWIDYMNKDECNSPSTVYVTHIPFCSAY